MTSNLLAYFPAGSASHIPPQLVVNPSVLAPLGRTALQKHRPRRSLRSPRCIGATI